MLSRVEWMEVLGDVYRTGVADGRRTVYLELLEQIGGSERIRLGGTVRRAGHEALEDAAEAMESLWNDHLAQFDRVGTGLGPGIWEGRGIPPPLEASDSSEDEGMETELVDPPANPAVQVDPDPGTVPGELAGVEAAQEVDADPIRTPEPPLKE